MSTDKPQYAPVEKKVQRYAKVWTPRLGIAHWDIEHVFLDSFFGDDGEEDFKITATTECRWNYMQAKIKWYLPSCVRHSDQRLEETVLHELCHVLLSPEQHIMTTVMDAKTEWLDAQSEKLELATELTTRALWNAYVGRDQ